MEPFGEERTSLCGTFLLNHRFHPDPDHMLISGVNKRSPQCVSPLRRLFLFPRFFSVLLLLSQYFTALYLLSSGRVKCASVNPFLESSSNVAANYRDGFLEVFSFRLELGQSINTC